jgi:uncharacterized Ntn-hydrolase superfamily protein
VLHISTFSIAAYDPDGPAWGVAVASKFPAVGAVVPWAAAGAGAVATQSYANTTFGPRGLQLMATGKAAAETLDTLLSDDPGREQRQAGLVDARGGAATFSGKECFAWAGGKTGEHFCVQGNILTGPDVVEAMAEGFTGREGDFPGRLLAALRAGDRAGGDRRGRQSAAILVVRAGAGYGGYNDVWLDYRVDDDPDPVPRLAELVSLHRLYFGKSDPKDELPVSGDLARELQTMMSRLGYYPGAATGEYDDLTRDALRQFLGNENFEDRTDFLHGRIDAPVVEFLRRKFAS